MSKLYMGVDCSKLKISTRDVNIIVDKENRTVTHIMVWKFKMPELVKKALNFGRRDKCDVIKSRSIGIAYCHPEDVFDENIGKRIARAKAESNAYYNAAKMLESRYAKLDKIMFEVSSRVEDFASKAIDVEKHNQEYCKRLAK